MSRPIINLRKANLTAAWVTVVVAIAVTVVVVAGVVTSVVSAAAIACTNQ